jgi:hypothetical protein
MSEFEKGQKMEYMKSHDEIVAGSESKLSSIESQGISAQAVEQMGQLRNSFESLMNATE